MSMDYCCYGYGDDYITFSNSLQQQKSWKSSGINCDCTACSDRITTLQCTAANSHISELLTWQKAIHACVISEVHVIPAGVCCQFVNKGLTPTSYIYFFCFLFWHCTQGWARCINTWVYVCTSVFGYWCIACFIWYFLCWLLIKRAWIIFQKLISGSCEPL
jgi:hypothetical protein